MERQHLAVPRQGRREPPWRRQLDQQRLRQDREPRQPQDREGHVPDEQGAPGRQGHPAGASGEIASQILPQLRRQYELVLLDVKATDRQGRPVAGVTLADLTDPDRGRYRWHFAQVDTVVHLAYRHPGSADWGADLPPLERFEGELLNVRMAQNVYRCALEAGARRVVMASSNHAADWYEHNLVHARKREMVYPTDLPLSDNFYGWAKAAYELLGFVYASGVFGRTLEVVQIRIGAPRGISGRHYEGTLSEQHAGPGGSGLANFKRDLGAWISARDLAQLFSRAIEAPVIADDHGVPWLVVYGISGNTRAFWSLENARRVLGYAPEDDSEITCADDIRRLLTAPEAGAPGGRVGG
ncbi:MAG: NAD(P)-dependent oxidoreductase [Candidatus Rokubacteria bacterium]|nr:NAD(P)-dependent oxidoreductase [Candidatus Rokubacteria bacterium]